MGQFSFRATTASRTSHNTNDHEKTNWLATPESPKAPQEQAENCIGERFVVHVVREGATYAWKVAEVRAQTQDVMTSTTDCEAGKTGKHKHERTVSDLLEIVRS